MTPDQAIQVLIPTSPIYCHPSTEILDETIAQLRKYLPTAHVTLLMDGVHPEESALTERYEAYRARVVQKIGPTFGVVMFSDWLHQSGMLNRVISDVRTPLILWMEHDLPLCGEIPFQGITDALLDHDVYGVRFIFDLGRKLNMEDGLIHSHGVPLMKTRQYVNWPQVWRTEFFAEFVRSFGNAKTYLECSESDGFLTSHLQKPYAYYMPEGDTRRCYHIDGRERHTGSVPKPYVEFPGYRRYVDGRRYTT